LASETATTAAAGGSATAATPSGRLRTSFVHIQGTAFEIGTVQASNGLIGLVGIAHFNERKPTRTASVPVRNQIDPIYRPIALE
jgi:hypothetical protein